MSVPSEIALRMLNHPAIDHLSLTMERLSRERLDAPSLAGLDETAQNILQSLEYDGVCATTLEALGLEDTELMFAEATELSSMMAERNKRAGEEARSINGATTWDLLQRPNLFHWGLNSRVLDIVEAYLRAPCGYDGLEYHYSKADGREVSTRRWHRDREDISQVKIIIYVNDVDVDGGPFEIVHPLAQKILDQRLPWRYSIVSDTQLKSAVSAVRATKPIRSFTGARGTVLFVDTARCHHHGKPPTKRDRAAVFYSFFNRSPAHPFCCERSPLSRRHVAAWARGLPERQRSCAMWWESLPLKAQLIPKSRLTV